MDASCRTAPTVVISRRLWAEAGKAPSLWTAPVEQLLPAVVFQESCRLMQGRRGRHRGQLLMLAVG